LLKVSNSQNLNTYYDSIVKKNSNIDVFFKERADYISKNSDLKSEELKKILFLNEVKKFNQIIKLNDLEKVKSLKEYENSLGDNKNFIEILENNQDIVKNLSNSYDIINFKIDNNLLENKKRSILNDNKYIEEFKFSKNTNYADLPEEVLKKKSADNFLNSIKKNKDNLDLYSRIDFNKNDIFVKPQSWKHWWKGSKVD
jgi:hypothetical protein